MERRKIPSHPPSPVTPRTRNRVTPPLQDDLNPSPQPRSPPSINYLSHRKRKVMSPFGKTASIKVPRVSSSPTGERFKSVLDHPFLHWKDLDSVLNITFPEWTQQNRGQMIHHFIHFLELKIALDEYISDGLLAPSPPIDKTWRAVILETQLYQNVLKTIQEFHGKPKKMLHYSIFQSKEEKVRQDKLRRTQSLFTVYFVETMPMSINEEQAPQPLRHLRYPSWESQEPPLPSRQAVHSISPSTPPLPRLHSLRPHSSEREVLSSSRRPKLSSNLLLQRRKPNRQRRQLFSAEDEEATFRGLSLVDKTWVDFGATNPFRK